MKLWELPPATRPIFADEADKMPNRYSGIQMKTIDVNFGIGVGSRPFKGMPILDRLRVGAMLMGYQSGNDQTVHLWLKSDTLASIYGATPENPKLDVPDPLLLQGELCHQLGCGRQLRADRRPDPRRLLPRSAQHQDRWHDRREPARGPAR